MTCSKVEASRKSHPYSCLLYTYTVCIILIVVGTILWYKRRKEKQLEERQKLFEIEKEKELYESKVDFFTEIAHEAIPT